MKNSLYLISLVFIWLSCRFGGGDNAGAENVLQNRTDSIYYALGANVGQKAVQGRIVLNGDLFKKGYTECVEGRTRISKESAVYVTGSWRKKYREMKEEEEKKIISDSLSYAMGVNNCYMFEMLGLQPDNEAFLRGVDDYLNGKKGLLDAKQLRARGEHFRLMAERAQEEKMASLAKENREKGEQFLDEKAKEHGVKATGTGLLYKVLRPGKGRRPKPADRVTVHYEGRLIDGTVFDSSYERGKPIEFSLNKVIKGWTEGLQLMQPGAKYRFFIPAHLAYGDRGYGRKIGPGQTLIFDVELIKVDNKPRAK